MSRTLPTVGILGGGQLARMLALAAAPLGIRTLVVDASPDACAGQRRDYRVPVTKTGTEPMDQEEWLTGALPG